MFRSVPVYFTDPWHRFLTENDLMGEDEVVFYYRPNQHVGDHLQEGAHMG